MKRQILTLVAVFGFTASASTLRASGDGTVQSGDLLDRVEVEKPQLPQSEHSDRFKPDRPEKPEKPDKQRPDKDIVKQLVHDFRTKAEEYKSQQQELTKKLKDAIAEDRAKVRDQMKQLVMDFQEIKEQYRDQIKDQTQKIKDLRKLKDEERDHSHGKER